MSILGDIEKLITERGSAAILREKVGLLDLKRFQAVEERDTLAAQLAQANAKIRSLELQKAGLQNELEDLRQQSQRLTELPDTLPPESEKMLLLVANNTKGRLTSDIVIRQFGLPQAKGDYFFDRLRKRKFVHASSGQMGVGRFYHATSAGLEYLHQKGLL
jgi:hypothetical protein